VERVPEKIGSRISMVIGVKSLLLRLRETIGTLPTSIAFIKYLNPSSPIKLSDRFKKERVFPNYVSLHTLANACID
jgi:hypothetical protein